MPDAPSKKTRPVPPLSPPPCALSPWVIQTLEHHPTMSSFKRMPEDQYEAVQCGGAVRVWSDLPSGRIAWGRRGDYTNLHDRMKPSQEYVGHWTIINYLRQTLGNSEHCIMHQRGRPRQDKEALPIPL